MRVAEPHSINGDRKEKMDLRCIFQWNLQTLLKHLMGEKEKQLLKHWVMAVPGLSHRILNGYMSASCILELTLLVTLYFLLLTLKV